MEGGSGRGATSGTIDPPPPHESGGAGGLFPRFTEKARLTIFFARYWARATTRIEAEHLLLGLIQADANLMNALLRSPSSGEDLRKEIERRMTTQESISTEDDGPLSSECRRILEHAAKEADRLRHRNISTGHFLLGFLREQHEEGSPATSVLTGVLIEKGLRLDAVRDDIARFLNEELGEYTGGIDE